MVKCHNCHMMTEVDMKLWQGDLVLHCKQTKFLSILVTGGQVGGWRGPNYQFSIFPHFKEYRGMAGWLGGGLPNCQVP